MSKFMNAELESIRDNLQCAHCKCIFKGTDSQAWHVKYEKQSVYCSAACRTAMQREKYGKPIPNRGPCPTCGQSFFSRNKDKIFCSLKCYVKSDKFSEHMAKQRAKSLLPENIAKRVATVKARGCILVNCADCGKEFETIRSEPKRFCNTICYRSYMAKRFDRHVANPETMALPQCYDEFLDREALPCIVEGCSWQGKHLTLHMNFAHGIKSEDFKRAAGFNLKTGVIGKGLVETLMAREHTGVATLPQAMRESIIRGIPRGPRIDHYYSLEAHEHRVKARALTLDDDQARPERMCKGCGVSFTQSTPFGHTYFHSVECREAYYKRQKYKPKSERICPGCGISFIPTSTYGRGQLFHSVECRRSHLKRSK